MSFEFDVTKEQKAYLSRILTGTDDEAVYAAVERACNEWGLFPDVEEPTDVQYADAEAVATKLVNVIKDGLEDGSVKPKNKSSKVSTKPETTEDEADAEILDALGV